MIGAYLIHYGAKGQSWGNRRYRREDGTWTEEGLRRRREREGHHWENRRQKKIDKNINRAITSSSEFIRNVNADAAASRAARLTRYKGYLQAKSPSELVAIRKGRTGKQRELDAKSLIYDAVSDVQYEVGLKKEAIRNKSKARSLHEQAEEHDAYLQSGLVKRVIKECANEAYPFSSSTMRQYSSVGRAYFNGQESVTAALTLGISSLIKNRNYVKRYSEEERWDRLNR